MTVTLGDQIRELETKGYVVLGKVLSDSEVMSAKEAVQALPMEHTSYSNAQWFCHNIQWKTDDQAILRLIARQAVLGFLEVLFGDEIVCTGATYARTDPGYPGMALHTDSQPYGSSIFGPLSSSPCMVRVLLYFDQLTWDCAPLRVVPFSHISMHADAQPYRRYRSHPEEIMLTCTAGTAIVINQRLFHAVGANNSSYSRGVLAVSFRPGWAAPVVPAPQHPHEGLARLARLNARLQSLFGDPNRTSVNTEMQNWHADLPTSAVGLGPSRWGVCDENGQRLKS